MSNAANIGPKYQIRWQIWVVIVLLSLEGVGNFLSMFDEPIAALWLASKVLTIVGLVKRWRPVYIYNVVMLGIHVLAFSMAAPFIAFLNLVLMVLTLSVVKDYFPAHTVSGSSTSTPSPSHG